MLERKEWKVDHLSAPASSEKVHYPIFLLVTYIMASRASCTNTHTDLICLTTLGVVIMWTRLLDILCAFQGPFLLHLLASSPEKGLFEKRLFYGRFGVKKSYKAIALCAG